MARHVMKENGIKPKTDKKNLYVISGGSSYKPNFLTRNFKRLNSGDQIIIPTINGMKEIGCKYTGILYAGLMIKDNDPKLIEYNIRFGDPECQVILPRLKSDLFQILKKTAENKLRNVNIKWKKEKSMTIVLCAKGYPNNYKKNIKLNKINNIKLSKNSFIYHAGTNIFKKQLLSSGGRILNVTSIGANFSKIRNNIISIIKRINLQHSFYRKDIGWKVIKK